MAASPRFLSVSLRLEPVTSDPRGGVDWHARILLPTGAIRAASGWSRDSATAYAAAIRWLIEAEAEASVAAAREARRMALA